MIWLLSQEMVQMIGFSCLPPRDVFFESNVIFYVRILTVYFIVRAERPYQMSGQYCACAGRACAECSRIVWSCNKIFDGDSLWIGWNNMFSVGVWEVWWGVMQWQCHCVIVISDKEVITNGMSFCSVCKEWYFQILLTESCSRRSCCWRTGRRARGASSRSSRTSTPARPSWTPWGPPSGPGAWTSSSSIPG